MLDLIQPQWPAPASIRAVSTTIHGGQSKPPYASNNLALHVGDNAHDVLFNRQYVQQKLELSTEPAWLNQTHSTHCVVVETTPTRDADAAVTRKPNQPLVILTADCLPILLCNTSGNEVAAIHAGWRGLLSGIIENTLDSMYAPAETLLAWIGPAICQRCYTIGSEIKSQFVTKYAHTASAFTSNYANLPQIAELILQQRGVRHITQAQICTFESIHCCYSYRRSAQTGRMGSLIWIQPL